MQRALIKKELQRQQRSYSWLAAQVKVQRASKQNVQDWLREENPSTPRNLRVFNDMVTALGIEVSDPLIPVSYPTPKIRYAGEVPAGDWGDPLASEEFIDVQNLRFEHPRGFATRVIGTSCYPYLQPGDLAIWRLDPDPNYLVFVLAQRKGDHSCTVKELVRDEVRQRPVLHSPNPEHGEPEDGEGWGVIARLVGLEFMMDGDPVSLFGENGITKKKLSFRKKILFEM